MDGGVTETKQKARVLGEMMMPPVIAKALVAIQKEIAPMVKSATNDEYGSGYVPLDDVAPYAMELLTKHRIAVVQPALTDENDHVALKTMLVHESGVGYAETTRLALDKASPQGHGSAITYMRRYALMAMLGLTAKGEDDDGNKASGVFPKATEEQRSRIGSLMRHLKIPTEKISEELRNVRTRDHADTVIANYEKMIAMRRREHEAEASAVENDKPVTHIDIQDALTPESIGERIARMGLKENMIVYTCTDKPFLVKCDAAELDVISKTLDSYASGAKVIPPKFFKDGVRPPMPAPADATKTSSPKEGTSEQ
ncbi:ERF family protein [Streptomyces cinereoruber]|uniref:ERF family protein n=1 Tax=Streptomyces cinereoruber TaxID=67260 RepID=UPI00363F853A